MGIPLRKTDKCYTYGEYKHWPEDERWELIEGVAWNMSPAPSRKHQKLSILLSTRISNYLEGKDCEIYYAPFDVLLPDLVEQKEDDVTTVVQPDISVICEKNKLTDKGCTGAPDWIIKILSPLHFQERPGDKTKALPAPRGPGILDCGSRQQPYPRIPAG